MTIGIGAICDDRKAIVLVTDRMISLEAMGLNFDGDQRKMVGLLPGIGVAATGTFDESESILERLRHSAELIAPAAVRAVAERMRHLCERLRWQQIERQITRPWLRMGARQFAEHCANGTVTAPMAEAFKAVQSFKPRLGLLVAGIDAHGAQLYTVTYENIANHMATGFVVIGSGTFTGTDYFIARRRFFKNKALADTIFAMYEVKRAAEIVTGVGPATEVGIIRQGEPMQFLTQEQIQVLANIYERTRPPELSPGDSDLIGRLLMPLPAQSTPESTTPSQSARQPAPGHAS